MGLLAAQKVNKRYNALIESIVYCVSSADIITGETWQGRDGTSVREDTVRGGAQMFQENILS